VSAALDGEVELPVGCVEACVFYRGRDVAPGERVVGKEGDLGASGVG
jgi:hypothetical protein